MNKKITQTINKYNMLSKGDTVLVAVSGGADSMLLIDFFVKNRENLGVSIKAAHIEHGIRGQESKDDARFVEEYCKKNNVELSILSIDAVNESKALKMGVEEYSRKRRYEFFDTVKCDKIATAHNLTDNCETLLFRLSRGTGTKGVCGIPPVRGKIIRPLIEISSSDIRNYCKDNNILYRTDSTNSESDCSRNKIRNEILPILSEVNSGYDTHISDFIQDINEMNKFLEEQTKLIYGDVTIDNKLIKEKIMPLSPVLQKSVIQKYLSENNCKFDRKHLLGVYNLLFANGKTQLYGRIFAVSDKDYLRIADFDTEQSINNFNFVSQILNINEFQKNNVDFYCDCDKIIGKAVIRERLPGDEIIPAGRNCKKSLKKLFNEYRIPVEKRNQVAVVCDDLGVIGIIGFCVAERVKIDTNTKEVITIKISPED